MKISPWPIVRAQHETYTDARTGRPNPGDYLLFNGLPLAVGAISLWQGVKLNATAAGALLAVSGLLGALLFGVMLQISERAMALLDNPPEPSREITNHVRFLRQLAANSGYAGLVCIAAAVAYVVATTSAHKKLEIASAIGITLGVHLTLVLLMVFRRVFALTDERLMRVRTGATAEVVPVDRKRRRANAG